MPQTEPTDVVVWAGVAQMECAALRELTLRQEEAMPEVLFCYRCSRVESVARAASWQA